MFVLLLASKLSTPEDRNLEAKMMKIGRKSIANGSFEMKVPSKMTR